MFQLTSELHFAIAGAEICVPKDYYLHGDSAEAAENTLTFTSSDKRYQVTYKVHANSKGTEQALIDTQMGIYNICNPISAITVGGLTGHCATYGDDNEQYFEARLLLEEGETGCAELEVTLRTHHGDIEQIKASPAFKNLLSGIHKV
ncbi:MAG: hypothetical protein HFE78_08405 [Clostridiales bacterium]|nr:hypothetical protein [Clostridiales bacterium]